MNDKAKLYESDLALLGELCFSGKHDLQLNSAKLSNINFEEAGFPLEVLTANSAAFKILKMFELGLITLERLKTKNEYKIMLTEYGMKKFNKWLEQKQEV